MSLRKRQKGKLKMQKPSAKWILIFNLVLDLPMAIVMSISANLLNHQQAFGPNLPVNILIGFCLAFLINVILPINKIQEGFAKLFKLDPHSLPGNLVGSLPVCLIFTVGIGLPLTWWNLRGVPAEVRPPVFGAFMSTFLPLFLILYVVAFIMTPIAMKAANAACGIK